MINETENQPEGDPRQEKFVVETELLSDDVLVGLAEDYCTRYHGLNDTESPLAERDRVLAALRRGELVVWFDPVENIASLGHPSKV